MPTERKDICDCGIMERCSKEPDHPIRFDARLNEYHLQHKGGMMMIYYCLFCGGRPPASRRKSLFIHVTNEEQSRLSLLLTGISTEQEMRARFGPPDEEIDMGLVSTTPENDGNPEHGRAARRLKYSRLSDAVTVIFDAYGDGRVTRTWYAKPQPKPAT